MTKPHATAGFASIWTLLDIGVACAVFDDYLTGAPTPLPVALLVALAMGERIFERLAAR